ncbi:hypothetical protein RclHR1_03350008 [Rhizophagus clarus]|uniref:Hsp70 family protein n=1 Tax=Rhizophagus clarus TaxID=94130 RepID=A0A2Z6R937_9GLOM|nr:hypothetical protein RclHR1_03350008 [Rhizophagus clarus]
MIMSSEVIGSLITDFNNLNEKCIQLIEENQNLKQQNQNLQQENISLREKLQEKDEQLEKLHERDKQYEKLEQHVKNLEKQKRIFGSDKTKKNDIRITEEENKFLTNKYEEQKNNNIDIPQKLPLNNNKDVENSSGCLSSFHECIEIDTKKSKLYHDIQVVVGLDFGTVSTVFSIHKVIKEQGLFSGKEKPWSKEVALIIKDTVTYDEFGFDIIELFNLHLGDSPANLRPKLSIDYKTVITDFLKKIGKSIKDIIKENWPGINYFKNVLLVFTIPEGYSEKDKAVLRECLHNAKLIKNQSSENIRFIIEFEAAALYCMKYESQKYNLLPLGIKIKFIIVDCGGSTIDITTLKVLQNNPLPSGKEITARIRDFSGSTSIYKEFIKFLCEKFGSRAIDLLIENYSHQFQQTAYDFCQHVKRSLEDVISSSVLRYTYGIKYTLNRKENIGSPNRKSSDGKINEFIPLTKKGTEITSDQIFSFNFKPEPGHIHVKFEVYYTNEDSATYVDEPGTKLLGVLNADLPVKFLNHIFLMELMKTRLVI